MNILFVCIENSNRSQMAQAFANIHGKGEVKAYSAGSNPSGKINPRAIKAMAEIGYNLEEHDSKSLSEIPAIKYDYVVSMGCGEKCPWVDAEKRLDWEIPDPKAMNPDEFRTIRNLIDQKVKALIATK